ncbi:MAG: phosphatase [Pelosinus sp.]|nr:phosphatase [Pelosinus sp.]
MQFIADLHTHTVSSGHAYSTFLENARAAADKGLLMIAITDHGPAMPGGPHPYHFGNQRVVPDYLFGVRVLKGIEANVIDYKGTLDLGEKQLARLDVVLAGLHNVCSPVDSVEKNTMAMLEVMKNPWVDIIVHPGNPEFPVDAEKIVRAAVEYDIALEINNSSLTVSRQGSRPYCKKFAELAKAYGAKIILGTDSHFASYIGDFTQAHALLNETGIKQEQVLNSSIDRILMHLNRRKNRLHPVAF